MSKLLDDVKRLADDYGRPPGHPWIECFHPGVLAGGEGCHSFASCHALWPARCEFPHYEHLQEGDSALIIPRLVALVEAAERFVKNKRYLGSGNTAGLCVYTTVEAWNALVSALGDA